MKVSDFLSNFQNTYFNNEQDLLKATLIKTSIGPLDNIILGLDKGELIVIGGRPGMGRVTLMSQIFGNLIFEENKNCLFACSSTNPEEIMIKLISNFQEINNRKLKLKSESPSTQKEIISFVDDMGNNGTMIEVIADKNIDQLISTIKRCVTEAQVEIVFVDFLQEFKTKVFFKKVDMIEYVVRELKYLALELKICIIAGSHVNRDVELSGASRIPAMHNLMGSTIIEELADKIILLHRWDYYGHEFDFDNKPTDGTIDLVVAKNNSGKTKTVRMQFRPKFSRFEELDDFNQNTNEESESIFKNEQVFDRIDGETQWRVDCFKDYILGQKSGKFEDWDAYWQWRTEYNVSDSVMKSMVEEFKDELIPELEKYCRLP